MSVPGVINFPASLDDAVSLIQLKNNASATLVSGISSGALAVPVTSPAEFPDSGYATIVDSLVNPTVVEIFRYTSKSGSDLIVPSGGRGQDGTTAAAFSAGAVVEQRPTARMWNVLAEAIIALQQKLETGEGVAVKALWTNTASGDAVANTTTETSLFTNATASDGAARTITSAQAKAGMGFRLRIEGTIGTTGTPTIRFRITLGAVAVCDSTAFATTNNSAGTFFIDVTLHCGAVGASGNVRAHMQGELTAGQSGAQTPVFFRATNSTAVDFTADRLIDVSAQWGTANAANTILMTRATIERIR